MILKELFQYRSVSDPEEVLLNNEFHDIASTLLKFLYYASYYLYIWAFNNAHRRKYYI